jgi:hypothetical protein
MGKAHKYPPKPTGNNLSGVVPGVAALLQGATLYMGGALLTPALTTNPFKGLVVNAGVNTFGVAAKLGL